VLDLHPQPAGDRRDAEDGDDRQHREKERAHGAILSEPGKPELIRVSPRSE
jgi:hypothetical protein